MTGQTLIAAGGIILMILVIIRMKAPFGKRMELSQTIASLSGSIRIEKGCWSCDFCQSIEDDHCKYMAEIDFERDASKGHRRMKGETNEKIENVSQ